MLVRTKTVKAEDVDTGDLIYIPSKKLWMHVDIIDYEENKVIFIFEEDIAADGSLITLERIFRNKADVIVLDEF